MSKRPTGTLLDEDLLLELRATDETAASALALEVTPLFDRIEAGAEDPIDWDVDERGDVPMLVGNPIDEDDIPDAAYPRRLREERLERRGDDSTAVVAPVPDAFVTADPPDGLGIDLEAYDDGNPLLFDAVGIDETVGLVPVRFDDGEPYAAEPLPDVGEGSDPVAEGYLEHEEGADPTPRPETMDAPLDPAVLESVLAERDVDAADVIGILEAVERHDLVGIDDHVAGVPPLSIDTRAVCLLPEDAWTERIGPELEAEGVDVDPEALAAARAVHELQARALIDLAAATEHEGPADEYAPAVTDAQDTAEWDVGLRGMERTIEHPAPVDDAIRSSLDDRT
ncbi:hypothetical protein ACFQGT_15155 [Natrialbaceae archaeon GCM10025810]|uniref:hypothetical protein n=1 Tax=Halovalidus salilacus TaxID=3075124 RepID=UPI00362214D7